MGRFTKNGILIEEFGLSQQDFFPYKKDGQEITIVRRAGIEKIASMLKVEFRRLVIGIGLIPGSFIVHSVIEARNIDQFGVRSKWIVTSASASPANCIHDRFVEIVENRVKHRAILMLANLHELHVHSANGSAEFERLSASPPKGKKSPVKKAEKVLSKKEEVERVAGLIDALDGKSSVIKKNRDLLK